MINVLERAKWSGGFYRYLYTIWAAKFILGYIISVNSAPFCRLLHSLSKVGFAFDASHLVFNTQRSEPLPNLLFSEFAMAFPYPRAGHGPAPTRNTQGGRHDRCKSKADKEIAHQRNLVTRRETCDQVSKCALPRSREHHRAVAHSPRQAITKEPHYGHRTCECGHTQAADGGRRFQNVAQSS